MKTNSLIVKDSGIHVTDGEVTVLCADQEQAKDIIWKYSQGNITTPRPDNWTPYLKDHPIPGLRFTIRTCREHCSQGCAENGCELEVAILSVEVETVKPIHYTLQEIIAFAKWYSGMDEDKVKRAYERYLRETRK